MASSVQIQNAKHQLPELFDRVEGGEEILIKRDGHVSMKLVPVPEERDAAHQRVGGQNLLGVTYIAPDFYDPMTDEELAEWGY